MKVILISFLLMFSIFTFGCFLDDTEEYLKDLKSENIIVRKDAIYNLGEDEEEDAVPLLIKLLNKDQPKEIRLSLIEALGKIGEDSSVDPLVGVLRDKDPEIRIAVVEALGKIKDTKAVQPLIEVLEDKDIQLFVIWSLGNIGDKSAVPVLMKILDSEDKYVRYNAAQALKEIDN